jgi:small subunit ribosomal protein S18
MMKKYDKNKNQARKDRHCWFCVNGVDAVDYKDTNRLRRYMSSYGKIVPRRRSGVCAKSQRMLAQAIKRARFMALLPYVAER